ncbi:MAG TPA: hypothetical protein VF337_05415 [Candidatus Limnocylindrales bacterium]
MDRTPLAAHSAHDELLIARLFGGDVSTVERTRALNQMGECGECAALFADLGDIADATEAIPVPERPRDFRLTPADAARLGRRRWGRSTFGGADLRRSLGGSLAALGVAGLMLTATTSLFGGSGPGYNLGSVGTAERAAVPNAADQGALTVSGGDAAMTMAPAVPAASTAYQFGPGASPQSGYAAATAAAASSAKAVPAPAGPAATGGSEVGLDASGAGDGSANAGDKGQKALDARLVWLAGFGLLFAAGLAIILVPWLGRRRDLRS